MFLVIGTSGGETVTSVADSVGNTWVVDVATASVTRNVAIARANVTIALPTGSTVTVTRTGAAASSSDLYEYSGILSPYLDKSSSATASSTSVATGSTGALSGQPELILSGFSAGTSGGIITSPAGLTLRPSNNGNFGQLADGIASNTSALNYTWGYTTSSNIAAFVATYYATPVKTNANLNLMTAVQAADIAQDDGDYFIQYGSQNIIESFKQQFSNNASSINIVWSGRSTVAPSDSPIYLQIYNQTSAVWETLTYDKGKPADTDFTLRGSVTANLSNYYDSTNTVSCRIYQRVI